MMKLLATFIAFGALSSSALAAKMPLAQAEHSGTYECVWQNRQLTTTYELNTNDSTMLVDMGTYKIAGFFQVAASATATTYKLGNGEQSGSIAFHADGSIRVGTGLCTEK